MAKLILNSGTPLAHEVDLTKSRILVGRSPDMDVQIHHGTVSSCHCELTVSDIAVVIRDMGSTNGSFIDGLRIEKAVLQSGQTLKLGDVKMVFQFGEISIRIPELPKEAEAASATMEDGQTSCLNHHEVPGALECRECHRLFCESCVRIIPRISGGALRFCPICANSMCYPYEPAYLEGARANKKPLFSEWLEKGKKVFRKSQ